MVARCLCNNCSGHLEFDSDYAGRKIECPHCGLETALYIPPVPIPSNTQPVGLSVRERSSIRNTIPLKLPSADTVAAFLWAFLPYAIPLAITAIVATLLAYSKWTSTPKYAIKQLRTALAQHDLPTFTKYLDVDTVSDRLINDLIVAGFASNEEPSDAGDTARGIVTLVKPRLVDEAKKQVIRLVETGNFPTTRSLTNAFQGLEYNDADSLTLEKFSQQIDANLATVTLLLSKSHDQATYTVELKLRRVKSHWQICELSNLPQLLAQFKTQASVNLARQAAETAAAMSRMLKVISVNKETQNLANARHSRVVYGRLTITLKVQNTSDYDIERFYALVIPRDPSGQAMPHQEVPITCNTSIPRGGVSTAAYSIEIGDYWQMYAPLYRTPVSHFDVSFNAIKPAGRPELRLTSR